MPFADLIAPTDFNPAAPNASSATRSIWMLDHWRTSELALIDVSA
jgi:hypothetical protein